LAWQLHYLGQIVNKSDTGESIMKKQTLLSAVVAIALTPTMAMSADSNDSFEQDALLCDSWVWLDEGQFYISLLAPEEHCLAREFCAVDTGN